MNKKSNFDVLNPSIENIEYIFKNLLYYLTSSLYCKEYSEYYNKIQSLLDAIKKMINVYENTRKLSNIDSNLLNNAKEELLCLKEELVSVNFKDNWSSYYIEWTYHWLVDLIIIRNKEIEGEKNAKR